MSALKILGALVALVVFSGLAVLAGAILVIRAIWRHYHPRVLPPPAPRVIYLVAVDERNLPIR